MLAYVTYLRDDMSRKKQNTKNALPQQDNDAGASSGYLQNSMGLLGYWIA